ncbi:MAG: hypothetical protein AMK73_09100, partial [Planctomycetes bacterium SM23_32]
MAGFTLYPFLVRSLPPERPLKYTTPPAGEQSQLFDEDTYKQPAASDAEFTQVRSRPGNLGKY